MSRRFEFVLLLAFAVVIEACVPDTASPPTAPPPQEVSQPNALSRLELAPASLKIEQGSEVQLHAIARNQRGAILPAPPEVTYTSSEPSVASVTRSGLVTGLAAGTAIISATTITGAMSFQGESKIHVSEATIQNNLTLRADTYGWEPTPAHVAADGMVEWRAGYIAVSGRPVQSLYLLDANYGVVDSVDISSGTAKRSFRNPGVVRYCSNACWDPPEFGIIYVH